MIEATPFPSSHHSPNIEKVLNEQISRIPHRHPDLRVVAVTDSAASMLKATHDSVMINENLRCIAHTINNACEDAFADSLQVLVNKCKQLAAVTHKSSKTCQILKDACKEVSIDYVKIIQPVKTRWNSMSMTMESIFRLKGALSYLVHFGDKDSESVKKLVKSIPSSAQFDTLEALLPHLRMIQAMSERLTSDKAPTLHLVIMVLVVFQTMTSDHPSVTSFLTKFKGSIADKFPNCGRGIILWAIASFLHPQNKGTILCFRPDPMSPVSRDLLEEVKAEIIRRVTALGWDEQEEEEEPEEKPEDKPVTLHRALTESQWEGVSEYLKSIDMVDVQPEGAGPEPKNDISAQIEVYQHKLQQPKESDCDVLAFWKANEASVPTLSKFARSILCIPASSASSERLFSAAGKIISSSRSKISSSRAEQLIYINQNYNLAIPYLQDRWDIGSVKKAPATPRKAPDIPGTAPDTRTGPEPGPSTVDDSDEDPEADDVNDCDWNGSDVDIDPLSGSGSEDEADV